MKKSDINILIVDDEESVVQALERTIKSAGYKTATARNADEAESICKIKPIHGAIIDCMLPLKNGIDLAIDIKEKMSEPAPIVLMSGIFKDRNYSSDALNKTGAVEFIAKPFENDDIIKVFEAHLGELVSTPKLDLHGLMSQAFSSERERRKALDHVEEITGFDLPFVFCILMEDSRSGHLNIVSESNEIYGVTIANGNIAVVDSTDSKELIKKLILRRGYVTDEDLKELPSQKGDIIKSLVENNLISPHVNSVVRPEQMIHDLNNLINGSKIQINFVPDRKLKAEGPSIDMQAFTPQIHDMIDTLMPVEWLKVFYKTWKGHAIKRGPQYSENHQLFGLALLQRVEGLLKELNKEPTLDDLFSLGKFSEANLFKALHVLMIRRVFVFDEVKRVKNLDEHVNRLKTMQAELSGKNPFEIFSYFGLPENPRSDDVTRVYKEFAKNHHPDTLPQSVSDNIKELNTQLYALVTEAHQTLTDDSKKKAYMNKVKQEDAERQIKAEEFIADAIQSIGKAKYTEAFEKAGRAVDLMDTEYNRVIYTWAKVKAQKDLSTEELMGLVDKLEKMGAEVKRGMMYHLTFGVVCKHLGDFEGAKKALTKAKSIDPNAMEIRREMTSLRGAASSGNPADIWNADLGTVIGNLFKKKS